MKYKRLPVNGRIYGLFIQKALERWNANRAPGTERLTHRRIAEELNVSPSYWSQVLAGIIKPSEPLVEKFDDLLDAYGIDPYSRW